MDVTAASEFLARSTTLTSVGWIGYIVIGAIGGWIAGKIVKGYFSKLPDPADHPVFILTPQLSLRSK